MDRELSQSGVSGKVDGRKNVLKHWAGDAMRYGEDEASAELFVLLKNLYTHKHAHRPTHRVIGRLREDPDTKEQGLEWIDVERETKKHFKKSEEEIPVLLARLSAEQNVRKQFEKELYEVHPVQYKPLQKKGESGEALFDDFNDAGNEFSVISGGSAASMSSRFAADTIPRDLRLILEQGVEIQNIWWLGKTVFSGEQQHEGVEIASRPPGGGRQKFIPVKHTLSEKSLVEEWATLVKSRSARNRSENKVLVDKFMKLRPHVGYKFETLSESEFKDVVGKVFPVKRHADHIREIDRQVELVQKDPTKAPEWARDLAKLRELKAAAKKAKDAGKAEVGGAPPLKKTKAAAN